MNWLARLKAETVAEAVPTKTAESVSVVFVGQAEEDNAQFQVRSTVRTPSANPDRYCWPHSDAMNGREIAIFMGRLARFTDKGLHLEDAEQRADALVRRDREGDDRRSCLECLHLQGAGAWRCGNWRRAGVAQRGTADHLPRDMVLLLQRCAGFNDSLPEEPTWDDDATQN